MIQEDFNRTLTFVSAMYGVPKEDILSRDRDRRKAYARAMVATLMREAGHSYPQTGLLLGRNHTSVMRMTKLGKRVLDHALRHFMTAEQLRNAERMAQEAVAEAERRRAADIERAEVAMSKVVVLRPELRRYDPRCHLSKSWLLAVARVEAVEPERQAEVWRDEMKRVFPFTAETPTALYGQAQAG